MLLGTDEDFQDSNTQSFSLLPQIEGALSMGVVRI
jgi:hypothetical protein